MLLLLNIPNSEYTSELMCAKLISGSLCGVVIIYLSSSSLVLSCLAVAEFPMERFLELLQDYCVHMCLTCHHDSIAAPEGNSSSLQERHHLLTHSSSRSEDVWENSLGCLYHSHSVVSAILNAKQLLSGNERKGGGGGTPRMAKAPTLVTLSKEDNSGWCCVKWVWSLLSAVLAGKDGPTMQYGMFV